MQFSVAVFLHLCVKVHGVGSDKGHEPKVKVVQRSRLVEVLFKWSRCVGEIFQAFQASTTSSDRLELERKEIVSTYVTFHF